MPREWLIQHRAGTLAEWAAAEASGPVLLAGERAYITDLKLDVVGDGVTKVASLGAVGSGTYASVATLGQSATAAQALMAKITSVMQNPSHDSFFIQNIGDSTSALNTTGIQQAWTWLAGQFPTMTTYRRTFDDTPQCYLEHQVVQAGTSEAVGTLNGVSGNYFYCADLAAQRVTGDLDVTLYCAMDDWTPAASGTLIAKSGLGGNRGWYLQVNTAGNLVLNWSNDGTAVITKTSTVATGVTDGAWKWVRATLDVDNGASGNDVKFYTSDDGATWTQLGATVTTAGVTSIFASTNVLEVGTRQGGLTDPWAGQWKRGYVKSGIGALATIVASPCAGEYKFLGTWLDGEGNTWSVGSTGGASVSGSPTMTIYNAGVPGASLAYFTDSTRKPKVLAPGQTALTLINLSKNDVGVQTETWRSNLDTYVGDILTAQPYAPIAINTQNPTVSPAIGLAQFAQKQGWIAQVAVKRNLSLIDVYTAFVNTGDVAAYTVTADGVHPNTAGYTLWFLVMKTWLLAAMRRGI